MGEGLGVTLLMLRLPLVVHERLGIWARQLRPRVAAWPVHLVETRSPADLKSALAHSSCPLVVIDLRDRVLAGIDDVAVALQVAPNALVLVLDPTARDGVAELVRELGAAHVYSGVVPPPVVAELLARWLPLALHRAEADGWAPDRDPVPEPSDPVAAFIAATASAGRP